MNDLRTRLVAHLQTVITGQLTAGYVNKDLQHVTGRNLNELLTDMRAAGYSMPGTSNAAREYFLDLGFGIGYGFRKTDSGARYGEVVLEGASITDSSTVTPPLVAAEINQVWERIAA